MPRTSFTPVVAASALDRAAGLVSAREGGGVDAGEPRPARQPRRRWRWACPRTCCRGRPARRRRPPAGPAGTDRDAVAERLGQRDDVRLHVEVLIAEPPCRLTLPDSSSFNNLYDAHAPERQDFRATKSRTVLICAGITFETIRLSLQCWLPPQDFQRRWTRVGAFRETPRHRRPCRECFHKCEQCDESRAMFDLLCHRILCITEPQT